MSRSRGASSLFLWLVLNACVCFAKDPPPQIVMWPQTGTPQIRFMFGKFRSLGGLANERSYVVDTSAQNLTDKTIANQKFVLYVYDKAKVRIGDSPISVDNVAPGQTIKFQATVTSNGAPTSLSISAQSDIPKAVSLTVNSVPQGAGLSVDGKPMGTTPKLVTLGLGKHMLDFSKDGFHTGSFPLEIGPDDTSGGSISYELGAAAMDTVELRDGSVMTGDVVSVTPTEVVVKAGGTTQHVERNKVKQILLTVRETSDTPTVKN